MTSPEQECLRLCREALAGCTKAASDLMPEILSTCGMFVCEFPSYKAAKEAQNKAIAALAACDALLRAQLPSTNSPALIHGCGESQKAQASVSSLKTSGPSDAEMLDWMDRHPDHTFARDSDGFYIKISEGSFMECSIRRAIKTAMALHAGEEGKPNL